MQLIVKLAVVQPAMNLSALGASTQRSHAHTSMMLGTSCDTPLLEEYATEVDYK